MISLQDAKDKIDGYFCMVNEGLLGYDDACDAINDMLTAVAEGDSDDAYDYKHESAEKFDVGP